MPTSPRTRLPSDGCSPFSHLFSRPFGRLVGPVLAATASMVAATPASAVVVAGSIAFTAGGFPEGAPFDAVAGTLHYSFDNSATFFGAADGTVQNGVPVQVSVEGLTVPGGWTPVLTYIQNGMVGGNPVSDLLAAGHALAGTGVDPGTDDWRLALDHASTMPTFREFTYARSDRPGALFMGLAGQVVAVPEPAAWMLWVFGLAVAGTVARRRASAGPLGSRV